VRDLLRKRSQLVRQRTANLLAVQNLLARNLGQSMGANAVKRLNSETVDGLLPEIHLALAVKSNLAVMQALEGQISELESVSKARARPRPEFQWLLSVSGIGEI
jgi:transposase